MPARYIRIPIKILTEKISHRTNSIFYAGRNIAKVQVLNREYVLTTSGEYQFELAGTEYRFDSSDNPRIPKAVRRLKDHGLKAKERLGSLNISNWGWFGINVWENQAQSGPARWECLDYPTDAYSTYDEAMTAFVKFVQKDVTQ
jgi:hypothetical protein